MSNESLTKEDVLKFLPHRSPFLFVDTVDSIVDGKVVANFYVDEKMDLFKGHFPGRPVLPGVIQIEMMAQAACMGLKILFQEKDPSSIGKLEVALLKVENAKFRRPILPGMHLKIFAVCTKSRGKTHCYDCHIKNDNEIMSEASLMASHNIA